MTTTQERNVHQEPQIIPFDEVTEAEITERTGGVQTQSTSGNGKGIAYRDWNVFVSVRNVEGPHIIAYEDGKDEPTVYRLKGTGVILRKDSVSFVYPAGHKDGKSVASGITIFREEGVRPFYNSRDHLILAAANKAERVPETV